MYPLLTSPLLWKCIAVSFAITALFYLGGIDWQSSFTADRFLEALTAYVVAVGIAYLPYHVLAKLLGTAKDFPRLQIVCFALTACLPLVMFPFYRRGLGPSNGWEYLLVPIWQMILVLVLYLALKIVSRYSKIASTES